MPNDQFADSIGIKNGVSYTISLLGGFIGVTLIAALQYQYVLFGIINACIFLMSLLVLMRYKNAFEQALPEPTPTTSKNTFSAYISEFIKDSVANFKLLVEKKTIFNFTFIFSSMNLISSGITSLLLITYIKEDSLIFQSFGYTVALVGTVETLAMIVGSTAPLAMYKKKSIEFNVLCEIIVLLIQVINIVVFKDRYILLMTMGISGYLNGVSNPRIDSFLVLGLPDEKQNSILSIFGTLVTLTVPIGAVIFIFIANVVSIGVAWICICVVTMILLVYAMYVFKHSHTLPGDVI